MVWGRQSAQAGRQLCHVLDLWRQHRWQVRGHWVTPGAGRLMADGQRHRTWKVELQRAQIVRVAWIEEAGRRWRWVADDATTVNAQWIVCNNIGGLNPNVGVNGWTEFPWLDYFGGYLVRCRVSINGGQRQLGRLANFFQIKEKLFVENDGFCLFFQSLFCLFQGNSSLFVVVVVVVSQSIHSLYGLSVAWSLYLISFFSRSLNLCVCFSQ